MVQTTTIIMIEGKPLFIETIQNNDYCLSINHTKITGVYQVVFNSRELKTKFNLFIPEESFVLLKVLEEVVKRGGNPEWVNRVRGL